jgi:hypothetical protein
MISRYLSNLVFKAGKHNHRWKGGRILDSHGYILINKPEYPSANSNGYVFEHRLIYEEYHKCCILPWIHIHHINENITDNRINNLELMTHLQHDRHHKIKDVSDRRCSICGSSKTYLRKERNYRPDWRFRDGKVICSHCRKY